MFWASAAKEEDIADASGFPGKDKLPDWLRPSLSYRGLALRRNAGEDDYKDKYIFMDVGGTLVGKFHARDSLILVGQLTYAPKPEALESATGVKEYRTREHYIG